MAYSFRLLELPRHQPMNDDDSSEDQEQLQHVLEHATSPYEKGPVT
jgi:hypothetical protein